MTEPRTDAVPIDLAGLLPPAGVWRLRVAGKQALLRELARRTEVPSGLPAGAILAALETREALGSTGVGGGIAMPHARLAGLGTMLGGFARLDRGIDYAAVDAAPVDLVFLLLVPQSDSAGHLAALAAMSRRLRCRTVQTALRAAATEPALRAALLGLT